MVRHKRIIMRLWNSRFTVVEQQQTSRADGSTAFEEATVLEDQPCKLSFSTLQAAKQGDTEAEPIQITKLFCDNLTSIKAGSKIIVQHEGNTYEYSRSGEPGMFATHQEVVLVPFRRWA